MSKVTFLNPKTCGIYKDGGPRFKTDPKSGLRTDELDNELLEQVDAYLDGKRIAGAAKIPLKQVFDRQVLVPTYFDNRYNAELKSFVEALNVGSITLGDLLDEGVITVRGGHGSPGNDQRSGHIPYVKVSDIRGLRINVNPTNLVTQSVAKRFWRSGVSGLSAWDVITPNRASSNIGEFAILLPGEEQIVITKEVFIFRVTDKALAANLFDPFYLLWALSLQCVRDQWKRVALMQTNREDCGNRYREIQIPLPPSKEWAADKSKAFRQYFTSVARAKEDFVQSVSQDGFNYVANVRSASVSTSDNE